MAQKSKGTRRKTRKKLTKGGREEGSIRAHLHEFEDGDQVVLDIDPAIHQGMPHPRFHGEVATVVGRRGRSYVVRLPDGGKQKEFAVYPAHLEAAH